MAGLCEVCPAFGSTNLSFLQAGTMSLISTFLKQTIYMGMPDDSVRNWLVSFPATTANQPLFPSPPGVLLGWELLSVWREAEQVNEYGNTVDPRTRASKIIHDKNEKF